MAPLFCSRPLPGKGKLFVQLLDRLGLAPGLQVEAEPAHVLEIRGNLLAGGKVKGLASKATGLIDVALADVGGGNHVDERARVEATAGSSKSGVVQEW